MNLVFETFNNSHRENVIWILNYYIQETTSAYREHPVGLDFFDTFFQAPDNYCGFAVKDESGALAGFCLLESYMPISTFSQVAETMYFIHPDFTGRGIGTAMLERLEQEARERGVTKLLVDISSENKKSINFHKKQGFSECGKLSNIGEKFGRHFGLVLMMKDLSDLQK